MIDRLQELIIVLEAPDTLEALKNVTAEIRQLARERDEALKAQDLAREATLQAQEELHRTVNRNNTLRWALQRNRQGYLNILEMRKLHSEQWSEHGERFGALTREEIEGVIAHIDAALADQAENDRDIDEALKARDLAREASNQDLEAKRQAERSRDEWQKDAEQSSENRTYYRSLVVAIGEMLGLEAYRQDDGGIVEDVLCAKVPELVRLALQERDKAKGELEAAEQHVTILRESRDEALLRWRKLRDAVIEFHEADQIP